MVNVSTSCIGIRMAVFTMNIYRAMVLQWEEIHVCAIKVEIKGLSTVTAKHIKGQLCASASSNALKRQVGNMYFVELLKYN